MNDKHCANKGGDAILLDGKGNQRRNQYESHKHINNYVNVVI